ncbi:glutamate--tRNA ligase [Methanotorris igneus]|uniref:Glutamate--tRNA ligase n=1 Tax=Methanotorris igneus (strain DSM 5666 / JCM 11834 / Kol 5) TaxID=880724 RepID=F6BEG2_METIK|nr:glutamate--tRNA ligase [Methanotorris igneus]AEF95623.1 glutamyl-tRNA synthetase [Methanotorris igneus Kol 5]
MRDIVLKYVLQNAIKYNGKANPKAVLGKFLAENAEYRKNAKEVLSIIEEVAKEVEKLSVEEQIAKLKEIAPEMLEEDKGRQKKDKDLELKNVKGKVIMRFAPNPSGPLHLGHARAAVLNDYFVKKYGGKLILRLEDTDPKRVLPEAYDMIKEDLEWLGVKVDEVVIQSDRMDIYYEYGKKLIEMGHAYVCECDPEEFRELRNKGIPCKCRERDVEENLELWEKMLNGEVENVAVRLKTDIKHKNPSIRDFPIFRIEKTPHPRTGDKYCVYPLMNFSVPIDDHLLGMTHVLRGKDHIVNTEKQSYIYNYFGWEMPEYLHYGILKIEGTVLSTSKMYEGIKEGIYKGWDDPRLGTLRALRRRGIQPEAIYEIMKKIGIKQADVRFSWENLYAINKDLIDKNARRFFFVENPKKVIVKDAEKEVLHLRMHPDNKELGTRELIFDGEIYVSDELEEGKVYRLMELFNIVIEKVEDNIIYAKYHSKDFKIARENKAKIIHWVPVKDCVKTTIIDTDAKEHVGVAEKDFKVANVGEIVQFERVGFVRVDNKKDDEVVCYFAHK